MYGRVILRAASPLLRGDKYSLISPLCVRSVGFVPKTLYYNAIVYPPRSHLTPRTFSSTTPPARQDHRLTPSPASATSNVDPRILDPHTSGKNNNNSSNTSQTKRKRRVLPWALALTILSGGYLTYSTLFSQEGNDASVEEEDTQKLYKLKSTSDIAFSLTILRLCSIQSLVQYGPKLLDLMQKLHLSTPAYWVTEKTFFKNFCAGTNIAQTESVVEKLTHDGIGVILDYAVEAADGGKEQWDHVADDIIRTIGIASKDPSLAFSCLKVSGLTSYDLLGHLTRNIQLVSQVEKGNTRDKMISPLSDSELTELRELENRLHRICQAASSAGVPLLIDAEETYYQPAIDHLTISLCKRYNRTAPIVYNTYQMYRKDTVDRLTSDIRRARDGKYKLGVKLVRGAYMVGERRHARAHGLEDPIYATIEDTHRSYHEGLALALRSLGTTGVMIATHNEDSVRAAVQMIHDFRIDPADRGVQFAQLYGMGDHLTLQLRQDGQRVFKYVPYGPIEYVMPYLIRRMQENTGFVGSTSLKERALLRKELRRRLGLAQMAPAPAPAPAPDAPTISSAALPDSAHESVNTKYKVAKLPSTK